VTNFGYRLAVFGLQLGRKIPLALSPQAEQRVANAQFRGYQPQ
jgi:hypothetical protein